VPLLPRFPPVSYAYGCGFLADLMSFLSPCNQQNPSIEGERQEGITFIKINTDLFENCIV